MNKKFPLLAAPLVLLAASTAATASSEITPYAGLDAQWRHMDFTSGLGNNLFRHDFPQGNFFVGARFCDYLGIEAGYEATAKKTRTTILGPGALVGGFPLFGQVIFNSTAYIHGPHINLMAFVPICNLELLGMVGLGRLKATFRTTLLAEENEPFANTITTNFNGRKSIIRLGGGIQGSMTECWSLRATAIWENTSRFKFVNRKNFTIHSKNSIIYSIGIFRTF